MTATGFAPGQTETESSSGTLHKKADEAKGMLVEKGEQARRTVSEKVGGQLSTQADTRSTQVAEQVTPISEALRKAGSHLEDEGNGKPGQAVNAIADRVDDFGSYLREGDADRFMSDFQRFGRSRPWVLAGAGVALGFVASRFLKASSPEAEYGTSRASIERYSTGSTGMATSGGYGTGYGADPLPTSTVPGGTTPGL